MRFELFKRIVLLGFVSALLLSAMLGAYFVNLVVANPVPYPAIRMPYEYIDTTISLDEGVMTAKVSGTYTFETLPPVPDSVTMDYPVPPDSEGISVKMNETLLDWNYTSGIYSTVIGDFPMIRWPIEPVPDCFNVTTYYEHPVPLLDGNYTFLYAMGTGRLLANWYKETTAYVTIRISMDVASPDTLNLYTIENSSGTWIWKPANYTITPENETWVITCAFQSESFQPLVEDLLLTFRVPVHITTFSSKHGPPGSPYTPVTECYPAWTVEINVTVQNQGTFSETFTVQAFYGNATGNYTLGISPISYSVALAPGASTTKTFTWDVPTSAKVYPYWTYTIYADVSVLAGETDIADNFMVDGSVKVKQWGDATGEGQVNIYDLTKLALSWRKANTHPAYNPLCDFTGDGNVDIYDLTKLAKNWKIGPIPG